MEGNSHNLLLRHRAWKGWGQR